MICRQTCRICDSPIETLFSLGDLYISTFLKQGEEGRKAPLEMTMCQNKDCELVQLRHTAPQELMYSKRYWYKSGINPVIAADLREIVEEAVKMADLQPGEIFLDIGANDGTLLSFVDKSFKRYAVEPAENLQADLKKNLDGNGIVITSFWENTVLPQGSLKPRVITAIGMFYDSEDPNAFVGNVAQNLAEDGIFVAQLMTLDPMVRKNDLGNICHEHLEYYSYKSLVYLFERNGLEIFRVKENGINGGSYRLFARHFKTGSVRHPDINVSKDDLLAFKGRLDKNKEDVVRFIKTETVKGKKVFGYGASTKGNTVLQYYRLNEAWIEGIADPNPEKIGRIAVGSGIPVVDDVRAKEEADYFLILPWGFLKSFLEKENLWRRKWRVGRWNQKGSFITHTPEFRVL